MNTLKNVVKKAIAVGSGAVMLGATTAGALAQLEDYPAPFIQNGQFDGLIVVGERAASQDIIGAIDIASSLQASATTPVRGDGGATRNELTGPVAQIGDAGDILEIGDALGDVTQTITDDDLEMLQAGTITTQSGTTDFTQTIDLDVGATGDHTKVLLTENNDDETGMYLFFDDGQVIFEYELEFTSGLESSIDETAAPDVAEDLEDESIYLMGQWYNVATATVVSGVNPDVTLELLSGEVSDTLTQGETKTYEIDGQEYEVTVLAIGNDGASVKFLVNGEATDSMGADDTETLSGGLEIGVRDIIETSAYYEGAPGSIVEFYLGANKITLTDTDTDTAGGWDGDVEINNENIEDLELDIEAVFTGTTDVRINSIALRLKGDAASQTDIYLAQGEGLREMLDEPEGMLGEWDIVFQGLSEPDTEEIEFRASGDDQYDLVFTNQRGNEFSVPYFYGGNAGDNQGNFGDEDDKLIFYEWNANESNSTPDDANEYLIGLDDYFIVTNIGAAGEADNNDDTYVLRFSDVDEDDSVVTFEHVGSGAELTATYSATGAVGDTPALPHSGTINVGGNSFTFWFFEDGTNGYQMAVDLDRSGTYGVANGAAFDVVPVVTRAGSILRLANPGDINASAFPNAGAVNVTAGTWTATLGVLAEDVESNTAQNVTFAFSEIDDEVDATAVASTSGTFYDQAVRDEDRTVYVNGYGTWIEKTDDTDDSDSVVVTNPLEQVEALVYVVGGEAQTSTSASGGSGSRISPIGVGAAVLDRDVRYDQDNMIVVGGPCVNTMAAQLLGNPADCAEGFEPGHAMIKLFDTGANTALLVAGYEAQDTVGASRVLAEHGDYELDGMAVDVVVESLNNIDVRPASN